MENRNVLVDTSIVIEYLRKNHQQNTQLRELAGVYQLYTSTIVEFELLAGATNQQKRQQVEMVLSALTILPFSSEVSQEDQ